MHRRCSPDSASTPPSAPDAVCWTEPVSCPVSKCALDARDFWLLARRDNAVWRAPHKAEQRSQESKRPIDDVWLFAGQDTRSAVNTADLNAGAPTSVKDFGRQPVGIRWDLARILHQGPHWGSAQPKDERGRRQRTLRPLKSLISTFNLLKVEALHPFGKRLGAICGLGGIHGDRP